jgi:hypothetical protein
MAVGRPPLGEWVSEVRPAPTDKAERPLTPAGSAVDRPLDLARLRGFCEGSAAS